MALPPSLPSESQKATRARRVLAALLTIGWTVKRQAGSHRTLSRPDRADFVFAFHDDEEIGRGCWPGSPSVRPAARGPVLTTRPDIFALELPWKTMTESVNAELSRGCV